MKTKTKKKTMGLIFQEDAKQNKEKKKKKVTGKTIILPILITSRINGLLG